MKVKINRIQLNESHHPNIRANISFSYDDRDSLNRTCSAEIDLNKQEIKGLPLDEIEKLAVRQAYSFFEEIIANCDTFSNFSAITIEL
ncbi:MAG: hypothetical protein GY774_21355 [Planctomycetes bacterium]|nr:hypothetical protein [Planctomycetota bacterium]